MLAATLKSSGAAYVAGIELHAASAALARSRLDLLIEGDITAAAVPFARDEFDYLLFADVLEHLPDPDAVVRRYLPFLKPGGKVIISVPNWRFYTVLLRLILDRWSYSDAGVRDRTHLRVFTRYSLESFVRTSGLELIELHRNHRLLEDQTHIGRVGAIATRISNATLARWMFPELLAFQYVAVAGKPL